jgi:hypothetical protein
VVVQLSRFSRGHARRLVEAVHALNPALGT